MKASTTLIFSALAVLTIAQTDVSPPFNPDPNFTYTAPYGTNTVSPSASLTPDTTSINPDTVTGEITLSYFTETTFATGNQPPVLTGQPSPRPSDVPENTDVVTPITSVETTVLNGTSSVTSTMVTYSTGATATGTTTTGATPSVSNLPAAAPKTNGGLMAVVGGVAAGVLGVVVGL